MAELTYRRAIEADLKAIVDLLSDDILGASRETRSADDAARYREAFRAIEADPNQFLCVVEEDSKIVGTFQLTFIPGLSRGGSKRAQIEAVRVSSNRRGEEMFEWAIEYSRAHGCSLMQLTTDKQRPDAHRFYDRLGFEATHIGYKMYLS